MRPSRSAPGADVIQIFDSWVGCLSVEDYRRYVLPRTAELVKPAANRRPDHLFRHRDRHPVALDAETGAEVIGLDWRIPLDEGWRRLGIEARCREISIRFCYSLD